MDTGEYLRGFWEKAIQIPPPPACPPIAFEWYRRVMAFLLDGRHQVWFAKLIVFGELMVGLALVLGAFAGLAAFSGGFMNWNFVMVGTASANGLMFAIATWLVLAWKTRLGRIRPVAPAPSGYAVGTRPTVPEAPA